ncbi:hypothetical protein TNCV_972481 [Trichonephila clavipes]|nr:hypothetical protein TNCV_972481 [Trichonephila clavipes]
MLERIDGPLFRSPLYAEEGDRLGFCHFALSQVSVPAKPALGHLRCHLTDVPLQTNYLPNAVFRAPRPRSTEVALKHIVIIHKRIRSITESVTRRSKQWYFTFSARDASHLDYAMTTRLPQPRIFSGLI